MNLLQRRTFLRSLLVVPAALLVCGPGLLLESSRRVVVSPVQLSAHSRYIHRKILRDLKDMMVFGKGVGTVRWNVARP